LLNARRAKSGKAVLIERMLPVEDFLNGQRVSAARLVKGQEAATDRCHDVCLVTNHPARPWPREIGHCKRASIRTGDAIRCLALRPDHMILIQFVIHAE
jgi:hypothetical protein